MFSCPCVTWFQLGFERSAASLGTPVSLVACHLGPVPAGRALHFSSGPLRKEGLTFYIRHEVLPLEIWPKIQKIPLPCFLPGGILLLGKQRMHVTSLKESSRGLMMPASALPIISTDTSELRHESQSRRGSRHFRVAQIWGSDFAGDSCLLSSFVHWYSGWLFFPLVLFTWQPAGRVWGERENNSNRSSLGLCFWILSFKCGLQFY